MGKVAEVFWRIFGLNDHSIATDPFYGYPVPPRSARSTSGQRFVNLIFPSIPKIRNRSMAPEACPLRPGFFIYQYSYLCMPYTQTTYGNLPSILLCSTCFWYFLNRLLVASLWAFFAIFLLKRLCSSGVCGRSQNLAPLADF